MVARMVVVQILAVWLVLACVVWVAIFKAWNR